MGLEGFELTALCEPGKSSNPLSYTDLLEFVEDLTLSSRSSGVSEGSRKL